MQKGFREERERAKRMDDFRDLGQDNSKKTSKSRK
jgi:hypothetical protein